MRKLIGLYLLLLFTFVCPAESFGRNAGNKKTVNIEQIKAEYDYSQLISAIIAVESKGDEKAVSANGKCCGILQITPILVKEVNQIVGEQRYKLEDRFDREKSIEMFYIMQSTHNPSHDIRKAVAIWNRAGWYYRKVMKQYNKVGNE